MTYGVRGVRIRNGDEYDLRMCVFDAVVDVQFPFLWISGFASVAQVGLRN